MTERMNEETNEAKNIGNVYYLDINKIYRNPLNEIIYPGDINKDISSLKEDIKAKGLDCSITVVKDEDGKYRIISGHGRFDSVKLIYNESFPLYFHGKKVEPGKIPCDIDPMPETVEDEMEQIIACNANKGGSTRNDKHVFDIACDIYETKVKRGDINPEKQSLFQYIIDITGISKTTFHKYANLNNPQKEKEVVIKIKKVSEVLKDIEKAKLIIDGIDLLEYGKTDKATIKESLDKLIKDIKSKK